MKCRLVALVLGMMVIPAVATAGDAEADRKAYKEACGGCHSVKPTNNFYAPSLHCIVGSEAVTADFAGYSADFREAFTGFTWDKALLSEFLEDQEALVVNRSAKPDAQILLTFAYPLEDMRANVIAYLKETCGE